MTALLLSVALCGAAPEARSEPVELKTPTGTLFGTLDLPAGDGPWPVVLLHAGSGPTDRDCNAPRGLKTDAFKMLGHALAAEGFACLRFDKRGIAASAKAMAKEDDVTLDAYAADAAGWVKWLRADKRFTAVAFAGHSEGSLVGLVAWRTEKFDAYVSLCGAGRRLSDVLREQLKGKLPKDLAERNEAILQALEAGKTVDDVPAPLAPLYRKSVQPFVISEFKYDPADEIKTLTCPVLIVNGTTDIQISVADGDRLAAAKPDAKRAVLKDLTHVLKESDKTASLAQQVTVYADPKLPLHPKLVAELVGFLKPALAGKK